MNTRTATALAAAVLASALPLVTAATDDAPCVDLRPEPMTFEEPVIVDPDRAGGEPVIATGHDGSISVSAHAGTTHVYKDPQAAAGADDFLVGYTNQTLNWRSADGGRTWDYIGLHGLNTGPHTATSTGFSDPDYAVDQAGNIYNTEINLVNVAVFTSTDDGQSYATGNPYVTAGDRPWLAALEDGEVFLYVTTGSQLLRSTDHGLTFPDIQTGVPITAKPYPDPRNPDDGLIGPAGTEGIAITGDDGKTWDVYDGAYLGAGVTFFDNDLAIDADGNAYRARARGYQGPGDTEAEGVVEFNYFDRDLLEWGDPVEIELPFAGDAMWVWLTAGDDGNVAVSWLMNSQEAPEEFRIVSTHTTNGTGTEVTCPDGSTEFVEPAFSEVSVVTPRPIHVGAICLNGTGCNGQTGDGGDRRLGEFFSTALDLEGRLVFATATTNLTSATEGPKPVSNPMFVAQEGGPRLREPIEPRETRCLTGTEGTSFCG